MQRKKKIVTVGNGLGVVIPKDILEELNLKKGEVIKVSFEKIKESK